MQDANGKSAGFIDMGVLADFQVTEPAPFVNSITPPVAIPVAPNFANLASITITVDDQTDRVWLNGTVGFFVTFAAVGVATVTFQLLRGGTVIYQTTKSVSSPTAVVAPVTVFETVHLEHIDTTPATLPLPASVTYTLRAQASAAIVFTSGPITLTAAELEQNPA